MKSKNKSKSLGLAVYFGLGVTAIITISLVFKGIDLFRNSKFDGNHRLTVAILSLNETHVLSVGPQNGTMSRLDIEGQASLSNLRGLSIPIDAYIESPDFKIENLSPKSEFIKIFLSFRKNRTNLSFIDLIRLSIYSAGLDEEKIDQEKAKVRDIEKIGEISEKIFKDEQIAEEKINIQITNTTEIAGLGNKLAKYITNLGGVVILVNTSPNPQKKSKIIYEQNSYTVKKLSKSLNMPLEKGQGSDLADVIIIIGEDRKDLFK